jgi:hypothetical protein
MTAASSCESASGKGSDTQPTLGVNVLSRVHGLRKAGATRRAEHGATEWEIASFFAHEDTKQAAVYVRKANRDKLGSSALARLGRGKSEQALSNPGDGLDRSSEKGKE